jgi:hypothetical protein
MPRLKVLLLSLATLSAAALGQAANPASQNPANAHPANPGTLNYTEGHAAIQGRSLSANAVGRTTLAAGQTLSTTTGKAEVLLTPGIFLRVGDNSAVEMVSPSLTHTEVRLTQGRANVEVDQIYPQNVILVDMPNGQTQLLKRGLYTFDAANSTVRVFDGKADVYPGSNLGTDVKPIDVKGDRELALNGEPAKPHRFDKSDAKGDLYKWSSLRSEYLGEANEDIAPEYADAESFNPGWYWAGGPYGYTYLPGGDGLLYSSFGYGFYSPFYGGLGFGGLGFGGLGFGGLGYGGYGYGGYGGGYGYGGYGGGLYGRTIYHGGTVWRGGEAGGGVNHGPIFRGPVGGATGGFRGGTAGGFHGGGGVAGGFHGGGGGGFHGGGGHR